MEERKIYIEIMERLFEQWCTQIETIKAKVQKQTAKSTLSNKQINNLQNQKQMVEDQLERVKNATDESWEQSRTDFEARMSGLKTLLDRAQKIRHIGNK
jgi:conjugal transfer/entry exclusion protein